MRKVFQLLDKKRGLTCVLIIFFFCFLFSLPIICNLGRYFSVGDSEFHVGRLRSAIAGWMDGQIVPQVNFDLINGFGYAYNLFYGPFLTYICAVLFLIIGSWKICYNLILILLIFAIGFSMFFSVREMTGSRKWALFSAISYLLVPYHFFRIYPDNSLGEDVCFAVLPLLFLGIWQIINNIKSGRRVLAVSLSILVLSHNLSLLIVGFFVGIFLIFMGHYVFNKNFIKNILVALFAVFSLTSFFTLPLLEARSVGIYAIFDQEYTEKVDVMSGEAVNSERVGLYALITTLTGVVQLLFFFCVVPFFIKKEGIGVARRFLIALYLSSLLSFLMTLPIIDWGYMPSFARKIQFPWRFFGFFAFGTALFEGFVLSRACRYFVFGNLLRYVIALMIELAYAFCLVVASSEVFAFGLGTSAEYLPLSMIVDDNTTFDDYAGYFWISAADNVDRIQNERGFNIINLSTDEEYSDFSKNGSRISLDFHSVDKCWLEMPLTYYPGYKAFGGDIELEVGPSEHGLVMINVPSGFDGRIKIYYGLSFWTRVGLILSSIGLLVCCLIGINQIVLRKEVKKAIQFFYLCLL